MQVGKHKVVVTRKSIKHLYLRVKSAHQVEVSAPRHWPENHIRSIVAERSDWITEQQQKLATKPQPQPASFKNGTRIPFEGRPYTVVLTQTKGRRNASLKDACIELKLPQPDDINAAIKLLDSWYRSQLKQRIQQLLQVWQPVMNVAASDFGVRKMKTRWGSCNTRTGKIWLNFDLIKKSPQSLEYVVVHELTHLYERYHNARFYALMDKFLPDWRVRRKRLNHYE